MPAHTTPQQKLAVLQDIMAGQQSRKEIAEANGVSVSSVDRLREMYKHRNGKTLSELAGMKAVNGTSAPTVTSAFKSKTDKLTDTIRSLRATGMTREEIARQLKISVGSVNYHLYLRKRTPETQAIVVRESQSQNGGQLSGINKHVFVGIYVAEAERLGHHIGERFGVSSDFLRSGLSEFLEYTKIRKPPRHGD